MDNFDDIDSLQSSASSLSGLSFYGDEFTELRYLINPSKYPTPHLDRSSTPKADVASFENEEEVNTLQANLQKSLTLNEQYKNDLQNLEKQIELKFYDKIDKLLRINTRLESELENANNQIERIIKNYNKKSVFLVDKEKLDLEKEIHQLIATNSNLQIQYTNLNLEKNELVLENKNLKVNLDEVLTDRDIKNVSIQSLKQKVSEQHVELQNCKKENGVLLNKLSTIDTKLQQSEKSKDWYKSELHQYQQNLQKFEKKSIKDRNQIALLNEKNLSINIEISKYKNDIDRVRLQALREKEDLFKKLENINLKSLDKFPLAPDSTKLTLNFFSEYNVSFYELTIEDLKQELSRIKTNIQEKAEEFDKLKQENGDLISKYLMLQKSLQQNESNIEMLEYSNRDLLKKLEFLKENEKDRITENLQLKNRNTELEIEIKIRNQEKQSVEKTIAVIRDQFLRFKENHDKVKNEVVLKDKEILQLQQEKQKLFMNNNWTICELEKTKEKDFVIERLKNDIVNLETQITIQKQKIRDSEFQILRNDKAVHEKEKNISEKVKEIEDYNSVIMQYKTLTSDYENKINCLHGKLTEIEDEKNEIEENFNTVKTELNKKDLNLDIALKNIEQLQNDHKNVLQNITIEKNRLVSYYQNLEEKLNLELQKKDACISELNNKFKKLENDCENYIKRITDDQKVEMLRNLKNANQNNSKDVVDFKVHLNGLNGLNHTFDLPLVTSYNNINKIIMNFFENLNMEELESSVGIRLKYLDEKLQKIKASYEEKIEKLINLYGENRIKELEVLLQVKNREMEEKQKKMDRNNRTLLRKVKEHMRGRNAAEKQLKYLQELYNCRSDECNTLKLSISSKEYKLQTLENLSDNYKIEINKLRNDILNLEKDLSKNKTCETCWEFDEMKRKLLVLEGLQEINYQLKDELKYSKENVLQLTEKANEQETCIKSLNEKINNFSRKYEEHKTLSTSLRDLEMRYSDQNHLVEKLYQNLTEKENVCSTNYSVIESLKEELELAKEKATSLSDEIKMLSSNLQQKVEYSEGLLQDRTKLQNDFLVKNIENQNLIADLSNNLILLQNEIDTLKKDKFFLQRLSNDLKIALQSYVEINKNLKEQANSLAKEQEPFNSLPPNILDNMSLSGKYDEKCINRLLEENNAPVGSSLTTEIQDCLSKLRGEIFSLQDQIIKKNSNGN